MSLDTTLSAIGVGLALIGIGMTLFLYFYDVRRKLEQIIDQLKSVIAAQHDDFSHLEGDFTKARNELLERQDDAIAKLHNDIFARLVLIEHHQEGIITRDQAMQLANLYLDSVYTHLDLELIKFAELSLPSKYKLKQVEKIMNELVNRYDATVRKSIRPMVSPFVLRSGQSFYDLVTSINTDAIALGFREIEQILKDCIARKQNSQIFLDAVKRILLSVGDSGRQKILDKIEHVYPGVHKS